ncbi:MAG: thiamine pyrophosphate-requiring protein [Thermomicrobiales bacterium]
MTTTRPPEGRTQPVTRIEVGETAEAFVEALVAQGVDCLFLNPGTDTFPVQEAIRKLEEQGRDAPRVILCLFEIVALAAAHGYYAATGRPQAVLVHVDVGTQNLGSMLHNAQRGRAAVVIAAGRAPYTSDPMERGSRSSYIHWLQEQLDQHGIVRNYTKWDYELRRADQVGEAVNRAFQVAASDPPGPVYMTLPRELLMAQPDKPQLYASERFRPARLGSGDRESLEIVTEWLVAADRPLVLTSDVGKSAEGYAGLEQLCDLLALPVVEWRNRANFPGDNPLHQGYDPNELLEEADVILIVDHDIPYIPTIANPRPDARVIQIDIDPVKERIPLWTYPVDLPIKADSAKALRDIAALASDTLDNARREEIDRRRRKLAERHERLRDDWQAQARSDGDGSDITPAWLGYCLNELAAGDDDIIVVDEMVTSNSTVWEQFPARRPESWYVSGGSGLGWGLGAGLGIKLARPDQQVVSLVGDGSFVFGAPTAALWAMEVQQAPVMIVIFNNACYNATKRPLVAAYPEGYSVSTDRFVGIDLAPPPRYDVIAEAVGAYGEQVSEPGELLDALRRGLESVRNGKTSVIDVQLRRP